MIFKKAIIAMAFSAATATTAHAAISTNAPSANSGTVTFEGLIIDAPCSIAPGEDDQTVDLGQVANAGLMANNNTGESSPVSFDIQLDNCIITTKDSVDVIFTGGASQYDADSLALNGSAEGAYILITDASGQKVKLNTATSTQTLVDGQNRLQFSARLKGGGASATVVPGSYSSVAGFQLNYQ
ncbi:fimbrial protein [Pantoea sp. SO10]|uniref:fimbrial protein n=1 Tax=Pantoea sp. SO10 TaxID=2575375 RepID=UPI001FEE93C1|nr:fimbrial protein [Pantoea sp. SO10]